MERKLPRGAPDLMKVTKAMRDLEKHTVEAPKARIMIIEIIDPEIVGSGERQ